MSGVFGNLDGVIAGIYRLVRQEFIDRPLPEPTNDAMNIMYRAGPTATPRSVESRLREEVSIADYGDLKKAIAALPPEGGVVNVPVGRWPAGNWNYASDYMGRPGIEIRGARMAEFSYNCDRTEHGAVIEGRFNVFADYFTATDVSFELGKYAVERLYGTGVNTHTASHPNGETWDAFAFAQPNQLQPMRKRRGLVLRNVRGLCYDSETVGHAVLVEGFDGAVIENVVGMYGYHGAVLKGSNASGGFFAGYGARDDNVIVKSDITTTGNIKLNTVEGGAKPPGCEPWSAPPAAKWGVLLDLFSANMDSVKIGKLVSTGAQTLLRVHGQAGKNLDGFFIDQFQLDGIGVPNCVGINLAGGINYSRARWGSGTIVNVADAIAYENSADGYASDALEINSLSIENCSLRGLQAIGYGVIKVGRIRLKNVVGAYAIDDTARVMIGDEVKIGVVTTFTKNPPRLLPGWQEVGQGFTAFEVRLRAFGVRTKGLVKPTAAPSPDVVYLPPYLQPPEKTVTYAGARDDAAVDSMLSVRIGEGKITINDGAGIAGAESHLSLDDMTYELA